MPPFNQPYPDLVLLTLLAHQGGWDEILMVAVPMVLIVGLLWLAKRRAIAAPPETGHEPQDAAGTRSIAAPTSRNRPTKSS